MKQRSEMTTRRGVGMATLIGLLVVTTSPALGQERGQADKPRVQPPSEPPPPQVQPLPMPRAQPEPRPLPRVEAPVPSRDDQRAKVEEARFEQLRLQALAARPTGGQPAAESVALLEKLTAQFASRVETENARIQSLAMEGAPSLRPGPPGGDPNDAVDAVASADPDDYPLGLDPCGKPEAPLEVEGVQATPPLDPGEWVLVQGCGLGTSPGKLRLAGDFPGGYLDLEVKYWASRQVSAQLPLVTGVGDMPSARLQLVRQDGKFSGLLDVGGFRATREVKRIHPTDITVTCGFGYPNQSYHEFDCTLAQSHPLSESNFFGGGSFAARHVGKTLKGFDSVEECEDWVTSDVGTALVKLGFGVADSDLAVVNLANGWKLAGYAWWWDHPAGKGYVQQPTGFTVDASSANVAMTWGVGLNECFGPKRSEVRYRVDLYAVGPKGVPYK